MITYSGEQRPLKKYFNYYMKDLRMGLVTCISGGTFIKTGNGKSYTALKLGEDIDDTFSMDNVVYYPKEFLDVMDKVEERGTAGQVVVIDEGELLAPANMYFSFMNKAISYNLATFRYLRCMAIFVTPSFSWLDKRVRTLVSHWGYTEKRMEGNRPKVRLKMFAMKTDLYGDRTWYSKIKMYNTNTHEINTFSSFNVNLPTTGLTDAYEKKSQEYKKIMRRELLKEMKKWLQWQMQGEEGEAKDIQDIIKKISEDKELMETLLTSRGNRIDADLLRQKFPDLKYREAKQIKSIVDKMWNGGRR